MPDRVSPCCGAEILQLLGKDDVCWEVCEKCMTAIRPCHKPVKPRSSFLDSLFNFLSDTEGMTKEDILEVIGKKGSWSVFDFDYEKGTATCRECGETFEKMNFPAMIKHRCHKPVKGEEGEDDT